MLLFWVCRCGFLLKSSVERLAGNRERVILKILVVPKDDNSHVLYYDNGTIIGPKRTVSPNISFFEPQLEERLNVITGEYKISDVEVHNSNTDIIYINTSDDTRCLKIQQNRLNNDVSYIENYKLQTVRQICSNVNCSNVPSIANDTV